MPHTEAECDHDHEDDTIFDEAAEQVMGLNRLLKVLIPTLILLGAITSEVVGLIDITPAGEGDEWIWDDDSDANDDTKNNQSASMPSLGAAQVGAEGITPSIPYAWRLEQEEAEPLQQRP